jgi:hypothetical protein
VGAIEGGENPNVEVSQLKVKALLDRSSRQTVLRMPRRVLGNLGKE